jgi:hypothetical protein
MAKKGGKNMTIEERLESMEREVGRIKRRNRWLLGAILLLVGGLVAAGVFKTMITPVQAQGAGTAKVIRAEAFVVEDENGKDRIMLNVTKDGPILALFDEKGKVRAGLGVAKTGLWLWLYDEKGASKPRAALGISPFGPGLTLYDENIKPRVALTVDKDGPIMMLLDEKGKIIWSAIK